MNCEPDSEVKGERSAVAGFSNAESKLAGVSIEARMKLQTKSFISLVARATALLLVLLSAYPTMASVPCQDQCSEATETHLPVCVWQDTARSPKGVVLLLHGIAERALTLNHLAQKLVSDGFLVYGLDERGHGWWHFRQTKNDPGYNSDFKQTVCDVDKVLSCLKKEHPSLPLFIIGESIGAAIALRAAVDKPDAVDGIVVSGSGYKTAPASMKWVLGDLLRNFWRWNHQINVVRYQLKYCTDDLSSFAEILKDPEHRRTFTINETIRAGRFIWPEPQICSSIGSAHCSARYSGGKRSCS